MKQPRLLYLGWAFPPGAAVHFPTLQPAGQNTERFYVESVRPWFEVRSVSTLSVDLSRLALDPQAAPGLPNELDLLDAAPEVWTRWRSYRRLRRAYRDWERDGWKPDLVYVHSFSPVYNAFLRWLHRQPDRPRLVLFLGDCPTLGEKVSAWRRFRYRFKPMTWFEDQILPIFDACVGVSKDAAPFFTENGRPWLWLPPGLDAKAAITNGDWPHEKEIVFGYCGSLGHHAGVPAMLDAYRTLDIPNPLRVAGFGKNVPLIRELARQDPRVEFVGTLEPDEPPRFMQSCDVLVNPRPDAFGNRYSFPSKLMEYGVSGRSIITTRMCGAEDLLGAEAFYFDPGQFDSSLAETFQRAAGVTRQEIQRRGAAIQKRLLADHTWEQHGRQCAEFFLDLLER